MSYHVKIDSDGRLVIPKRIREQLCLAEGVMLELEVKGQSLVLEVRNESTSLEHEDGMLIAAGKLVTPLSRCI